MISVFLAFLAKKVGFKAFQFVVKYFHRGTIVKLLKSGGIDALKAYEHRLLDRMVRVLWFVGIPTTTIAELLGFISVGAFGVIIVGLATIMAFDVMTTSNMVNGAIWKRSRYSVKTIVGSLPVANLSKRKLFKGLYNFATAKSLRQETGLIRP